MFRLFNRRWPQKRYASPFVNNSEKRLVANTVELKETYNFFDDESKHLSPLNGAILSKTKAIERLYEQSLIDSDNLTATGSVVTSLFNQLGNEFRATQNKSNPGYSLTPAILAEVIYHLNHGTLVDEKIKEISFKWKKQHLSQTGSKLSNQKLQKLFIDLIISIQECREKKYPAHFTQLILLTFLIKKSASRQEVLDYLKNYNRLSNNRDESPLNDNEFIDKEYIETGNELISRINKIKNNTEAKRLLKDNYEKILFSLLLNKSTLDRVELSNYGYHSSEPKPNCTEVSFHNICNILLFNHKTNLFDLSLLPSTLKPNEKLISIYKKHDFKSDKVNAPEIGQSFMDLLSENPAFIYVCKDFELETTTHNFIPVLNYLFGTQANTLEELSRLFSDEKRQITFNQKDNVITMTIEDDESLTPHNEITLTFTQVHCEFEADCFKQQEVSLLFTQLHTLAFQQLGEDPLLFTLLHEFYLEKFRWSQLTPTSVTIEKVNSVLYNKLPHDNEDAYLFIKCIMPLITSYPHLRNYVKYLHTKQFELLNLAVSSNSSPMVDLLLDCGGNPDYIDFECNSYLHDASDPAIAKSLLKAGAKVDAINKKGQTALHTTKSVNIAIALIEYGADVNYIENDGTPLIFKHLRSLEMVKLLLDEGADPNATDNMGNTALFYCSNEKVIRAFLNAGADPNALNNKACTPLHFSQNGKVAQALIDGGADPKIKNLNGRSALETIKFKTEIDLISVDTLREISNVINHATKEPAKISYFKLRRE